MRAVQWLKGNVRAELAGAEMRFKKVPGDECIPDSIGWRFQLEKVQQNTQSNAALDVNPAS